MNLKMRLLSLVVSWIPLFNNRNFITRNYCETHQFATTSCFIALVINSSLLSNFLSSAHKNTVKCIIGFYCGLDINNTVKRIIGFYCGLDINNPAKCIISFCCGHDSKIDWPSVVKLLWLSDENFTARYKLDNKYKKLVKLWNTYCETIIAKFVHLCVRSIRPEEEDSLIYWGPTSGIKLVKAKISYNWRPTRGGKLVEVKISYSA
jgi:hypothetical protein